MAELNTQFQEVLQSKAAVDERSLLEVNLRTRLMILRSKFMSEQESETISETKPVRPARHGKRWLMIVIVLLTVTVLVSQGYGIKWTGSLLSSKSGTNVKLTGDTQFASDQKDSEQKDAVPLIVADDVLGTWVLDGAIRRVIETRNDGTATIQVTFDFLTALRYGSELQLDLEWTLKDNMLTHTILGGTPEKGKKRLISDFGNKAYFKILRISEDEMHLVDFDDPPEEYLWKRMPEEVSATTDSKD